MNARKTVRAAVTIDFQVDATLPDEEVHKLVDNEVGILSAQPPGSYIDATDHQVVEILNTEGRLPFTVIFFIDADRAVETFCEEVMASCESEAWHLAIRQAYQSGCSRSGHSISKYEFENATEIATFLGHRLGEASRRLSALVTTLGPKAGDTFTYLEGGEGVVQTSSNHSCVPNGVWSVLDQHSKNCLVARNGDQYIQIARPNYEVDLDEEDLQDDEDEESPVAIGTS